MKTLRLKFYYYFFYFFYPPSSRISSCVRTADTVMFRSWSSAMRVHTICCTLWNVTTLPRRPNTQNEQNSFLFRNRHPKRDSNSERQLLRLIAYQCATVTRCLSLLFVCLFSRQQSIPISVLWFTLNPCKFLDFLSFIISKYKFTHLR